jgi:subtilisin family serine protease
VTSPATAKNCITVGASESVRPQFDHNTYGGWWPQDYPVAPYRSAPMADRAGQVAAFSSRGPTLDGRVKPDVVAPGTFILSARSRKLSTAAHGWSAFPPSSRYFYMGGTSMATPLCAGAVACLREFLRRRVRIAQPSAALLKACLVLGAEKLRGYSPAGQVWDDAQGYGRVRLDAVVDPPGGVSLYVHDDAEGLRTGATDAFDFEVRSSTAPLRIALAYSDFPGERLINNLNLLVTSPAGRTHVGNGSGTSLETDTRINVEVVHVARPARGTWSVRIVASDVPEGPQDYAFAASGRLA